MEAWLWQLWQLCMILWGSWKDSNSSDILNYALDMHYKFSPIKTEAEFRVAVDYIANQTTALCRQVTGVEFPIVYLTIFAHYEDEFENLRKMVESLGEIVGANNGFAVQLKEPIKLMNGPLQKIRIRKPDLERPQVGCNDFVVPNYEEFKQKYLQDNPDNLRLIQRPEYDMIEFFDPGFDVLA